MSKQLSKFDIKRNESVYEAQLAELLPCPECGAASTTHCVINVNRDMLSKLIGASAKCTNCGFTIAIKSSAIRRIRLMWNIR